ncbi:hypothetical protein [Halorussus caseinilyticus]|uniref:Uncharacterized protein n=1 Tax=Halorussus caseinilyticus TaxID=3034025 RepID=A0ABD5WTK4_9EURY|nr:hypothetical protein [Halorussus sp. DT72]
MTERGTDFTGFVPDAGQQTAATERSPVATALFVVGVAVAAANSALYFFGVESLSHPVVSILALALLVPLYLRER